MDEYDYDFAYVDYNIDTETYNYDKIKTKLYKTPHAEYTILNYDDKVICNDDTKHGMYRSIILSSPENKIVCFSPPKSIELDSFISQNPEINDSILVNEIIEGTMINLFYDKRLESWEIASKGAVGGNYWFYRNQYPNVDESDRKQLTFREMFLEAFRANTDNINDLPFLEFFPKDYCYNFVLQHPENHIVLNISSPIAYLVGVYHIREQNKVVMITPHVFEEWDCFLNIRGMLEFPSRPDEYNYEKLRETYCSYYSPYHCVGLMFTNLKTGERCNMENPAYASVRELRGNNPNLQYQYLCLRRIGKVMDFLNYFPQYKTVFYKFHTQYNEFINTLHQSYISYYVRKTGVTISKKYFPLVYKLHHEIYIPSLVSNSKIIMRRNVIADFVSINVTPSEVLFYLNYNRIEIAKASDMDRISEM